MRCDLRPIPALTVLSALAVLGMLAAPGSAWAAEPLAATVTKVNDGDSIEVKTASGNARVRLSAIDTPEYDQPHAAEAVQALRKLLPVGTPVELEVVTQDQFRRIVAVVWLVEGNQRINVNERLLTDGHAWAYRRYMPDAKFCEIEAAARTRKAGLWARPVSDWVYPPEWRLLKNGEIRTLPTPYPETLEKCLSVLALAGAGTYEPPR